MLKKKKERKKPIKVHFVLYIGIALGKKDIGGFGFFINIAGKHHYYLLNNIFFYQKRVS